MHSFTLENTSPSVTVSIPDTITELQLREFRPFKEWLETMQTSIGVQAHADAERYTLREVKVQAVQYFTPSKIGFILMETVVQNEKDERPLPGIVFLRGGSVAALMILSPENNKDERWVIMTRQPRIPAGSLSFYEIPAGMIDKTGTLQSAAMKEIKEETGIRVAEHDLQNLTEMALDDSEHVEKHLQKAMYPSPGGSDEFIAIFLWKKEMPMKEINKLRGKLTGNRKEREKIEVKLVKYEELWKEGARDAKTLAAWALYEGLYREGRVM